MLVIAFAQPYIPKQSSPKITKNDQICIYIDNSFSTEAVNKYGKISELSKKYALEILNAYSEGTDFLFLTNDFEIKHQHMVSKEQMKTFIQETGISPVVRNLSEVIQKAGYIFSDLSDESEHRVIYLISDFQKSSSDLTNFRNDSITDIVCVPIEAELTNNLFIDSLWFESPGRPLNQPDEISVRISNLSNETYTNMPINLYLNNTLKSTGSFNIDANASIDYKLGYTNTNTGIIKGKIEISDFPVTYDNEFFFNINISQTLKTLLISDKGPNRYIEDIFKNIGYIQIFQTNSSNTGNTDFYEYDAVILNEPRSLSAQLINELVRFVSDGGNLIIFPSVQININAYNDLFNRLNISLITGIDSTKIYAERINYEADIFKNVFKKQEQNLDLPYILKRLKFSDQSFTNEEVILFSENNDKLISRSVFGKGLIYVFSQSADESSGNLVYHPIWIPMIYNMVFLKNESDEIYHILGKESPILIKGESIDNEDIYHIVNEARTTDMIPRISETEGNLIKVFPGTGIKDAGHFEILLRDSIIKGFSLNYDRKESDLSHYTSAEIRNYLKENGLSNFSLTESRDEYLSEIIKDRHIGKQLWKLFLILALFFLLCEIIIVRLNFSKKESRSY
jgi:hypothetical protein